MTMEQLLLTTDEAARQLACGKTLLYELIAAREIPVIKLGRLTRISVHALDTYVRQRDEEAARSISTVSYSYRHTTNKRRARRIRARAR